MPQVLVEGLTIAPILRVLGVDLITTLGVVLEAVANMEAPKKAQFQLWGQVVVAMVPVRGLSLEEDLGVVEVDTEE